MFVLWCFRAQSASPRRSRLSRTAWSPDLRTPGGLRPLLQMHQRHTDAGTVRERSSVRWEGQRPQSLQLPLGRRMWCQEGCL